MAVSGEKFCQIKEPYLVPEYVIYVNSTRYINKFEFERANRITIKSKGASAHVTLITIGSHLSDRIVMTSVASLHSQIQWSGYVTQSQWCYFIPIQIIRECDSIHVRKTV